MTREELEKQILEIVKSKIMKRWILSDFELELIIKEIASLIEQNNPVGEYFEKVYVRSEDDLPEIHDLYLVETKENGLMFYYWHRKYSSVDWMTDVDWYLRPVKQINDSDDDQNLAGDYDIHIPFKAKDGKRYKLIPVEQKSDCYPKKFVIWIGFNRLSRLMYREIDDKWLLLTDIDQDIWIELTTDELFEYWKINIKNE